VKWQFLWPLASWLLSQLLNWLATESWNLARLQKVVILASVRVNEVLSRAWCQRNWFHSSYFKVQVCWKCVFKSQLRCPCDGRRSDKHTLLDIKLRKPLVYLPSETKRIITYIPGKKRWKLEHAFRALKSYPSKFTMNWLELRWIGDDIGILMLCSL